LDHGGSIRAPVPHILEFDLMNRVAFALFCTLAAASLSLAAPPIGFYPLEKPDPSFIYSFGGSISGDGMVAGGESGLSSFSPRNNTGVLWSGSNYSTITLATPPASQQPYGYVMGLNQDGTVGSGLTNISTGTGANDVVAVPFRWTAETGVQLLSSSSGTGHDVTPTGNMVVGQTRDPSTGSPLDGFRWTAEGGMQLVPRLPGAAATGNVQTAYGVTADGEMVVGRALNGDAQRISVAYAWTPSLGSVQLQLLPGATGATAGQARSIAWETNLDGTVIVGEARDSQTGRNAALWRFNRATGESIVENLGDLPGAPASNPLGVPNAVARDVSSDGTVVVGDGQSAAGNEAFVWFEGLGMFPLRTYLVDTLGFQNLDGWTLTAVTGLSYDGTVINGYGSFQGATQAWVAVIGAPVPEPASAGILLLGVGMLAALRRSTVRRS
jgi:PEP-CTERM motif